MNKRKTDERTSESIFEDEDMEQTSEKTKGSSLRHIWWKAAIVLVLVAAVAVIIAGKQGESQDEQVESGQVGRTVETADSNGRENTFPSDTVLATVNGEDITLAELESELQEMPRQYRSSFKNNQRALLGQLISRELLLQKVQEINAGQNEEESTGEEQDVRPEEVPKTEDKRISELLQKEVLGNIEVTDQDVKAFYEKNKDQMPAGRSFEELKDSMRAYARQEKENEAIDAYLSDLRETAEITFNQEWIEAQEAQAANNPLDRALDKNVPVLADFGRDSCVPCKMMKPILDDLKEEYKGRAEILIIKTDEYPAITQRVGVRAIPTQIFYDAEGNEVSRHQGFMSREAIVEELREMGVE